MRSIIGMTEKGKEALRCALVEILWPHLYPGDQDPAWEREVCDSVMERKLDDEILAYEVSAKYCRSSCPHVIWFEEDDFEWGEMEVDA